jgi:epoxide hydrolase-like predicted phosphatase
MSAPRSTAASRPVPSALVVDWGGVLTADLDGAMAGALSSSGVDLEQFAAVLRDWLGPAAALEARVNPLHALERGEIGIPHFEERLAHELERRQGQPIDHHGLLQRMFDAIEHAPDMNALVVRARQSGLRTALLSNSWGNEYPRDGWDDMFDAVVISGEVGMRKPEPRIYEHAAMLLSVRPADCAFVDDLRPNVDAAIRVGMVGVHHTDYASTAMELEAIFGIPLAR